MKPSRLPFWAWVLWGAAVIAFALWILTFPSPNR